MSTEQNTNEAQGGGSGLNVELDDMMYKPQQGEWKLIAPDGTVFVGDSPLRCVKAEIDYRVPAHVQLQRLLDGIDALDEDAEYSHEKICNYPDCTCPFDHPGTKGWCARGHRTNDA